MQSVMGYCAIHSCGSLKSIYYGGDYWDWEDICDSTYNLHLSYCGTPSILTDIANYSAHVSADKKTITVYLNFVDSGRLVILALYSDDTLVEMQKAVYNANSIEFTTDKEFDSGKVMIWKDLESLKPLYKNDAF